MNDTDGKTVVLLQTGLFPDAATVGRALGRMESGSRLQRHELDRDAMTEADWDRILSDILHSEKVITV